MNVKSIKKGFTLTELIIVIVIIGILAGVLIPTFINVVNKANKAADLSLIRNLNEALVLHKYDKGEHKNMTEALEAADEYGYEVDKIDAKVSKNKILWDSKNDVFCYLNGNQIEYYPDSVKEDNKIKEADEYYKLWIIASEPSDVYSTYLSNVDTDTFLGVKTGIDAGKENISAIKYIGTDERAQDVIIRTNGGALTVDAKVGTSEEDSDKVTHYGFAESISIAQVYEASYHEFGSTYQIDINKGRIVLESGSKVWAIHLNANTDKDGYDTIKIATTEGVDLPEIVSREEVEVENDIIMVELQQLNDSGNIIEDKTEEVWILVEKNNIADKEDPKNEEVVSDLGQMFLESTSQTNVVDDKEETKQQAKLHSIKVDEKTYELSSKEDLLLFASLVNSGETFAGCTVNLVADINLDDMNWTPIGYLTETDYSISYQYDKDHRTDNSGLGGLVLDSSKPFSGKFNGGGHTISNFKPVQDDDKVGLGLFGLVYSSSYNSQLFGTESAKDMIFQDSTIQQSKLSESNYGCVISNLNVENVVIGSGNDRAEFAGAIAGITYSANINLCTVDNLEIYGSNVCGGIVGLASASVVQNCSNGSEEAPGSIDSIQNAGGIVGASETYFYASGYSRTVISSCVNYCDVSVDVTNSGGVIGLGQGYGQLAIIDCHNVGDISILISSGNNDRVYNSGGIAGNGASISLFYSCSNNGAVKGSSLLNISQPEKTYHGVQVGGIASYMSSGYFYNCINNGDISGNANYMGGIVSATHNTSSTLTLVNCGNNGQVNNSYSSGKESTICSAGSAIINFVGIVDKLSYIQEYLNQLNSDVDFTQITVLDKGNGELVMPATDCANVVVNTNVCDSIIINSSNQTKLTINCPGVDVIINGDINSTNVVVLAAKSITVSSLGVAKELTVGNVSNVVNNGTLASMQFIGNQLVIDVVNNGTIAKTGSYAVSFYSNATASIGNYVTVNFLNRGTVSSTGHYPLSVHNGNNNVIKFHCCYGSVLTVGSGTGFSALIRTDADSLAGNYNQEAIYISYDNDSCKQFGYFVNSCNGLTRISKITDSDFDFDTNY